MISMFYKALMIFGILSVISCKSEIKATKIESQYYTDSIYSNNLSEYRKHNIYLPKNFNTRNSYPIIYGTDGSIDLKKSSYKNILDSLINNNIIRPIIYIASHSNRKIADSTISTRGDGSKNYLAFRNFEYISDYNSLSKDSLLVNRFENHMLYFSEELIPHIEKDLKQKTSKNDRLFYGVSNGAGFGASLIKKKPDLIGTYLCFSTFGGDFSKDVWKEGTAYADLYIKFGTEEPFFLKEDAKSISSRYKNFGLFCNVEEFDGGHDGEIWKYKFAETLDVLFKK